MSTDGAKVHGHLSLDWPSAHVNTSASHRSLEELLAARIMTVIGTFHLPGLFSFDHSLHAQFGIRAEDREEVEARLRRLLDKLEEEFGIRYELRFEEEPGKEQAA